MRSPLNNHGMTLVELMVSVGLFGMVSLMVSNVLLNYAQNAKKLENQRARDALFLELGRLAGNPAALLKSVNTATWPTGTNACLRTCVMGGQLGTTTDSCSSGTYLCVAMNSAGSAVWQPLSLKHPFSGTTVASDDADPYTRYTKNGEACPGGTANPSALCPFIAVTQFSPSCPDRTTTCVRLHSIDVKYVVKWDSRLTAADQKAAGTLSTVQHEGVAHLNCSEILGSAVCISVASVFYWTGLGGDGLWSTASNWSTNAVPTSSDTAVFDNRCSSCNSVVDTNFSVYKVDVKPTYTGILSVNTGITLTVTAP